MTANDTGGRTAAARLRRRTGRVKRRGEADPLLWATVLDGAMVKWHRVADVLAGMHTGDTVRLRGWVHRQRTAGKMAFVVLRDGTGIVQCTVKAGVADDASLAAAKDALIESSVSLLEGTVVADERAPGGYEVKVTQFRLHQRSADFPLRGEQGTEFELDNRHLWLRSTQLSTILRIKHRLLLAIREFYDREGFVEVDPSVITTNACEGGSTLFTFDYFGQTAYLSQSAQMYLEGCIFGLPKVYSITNSFRAEKSRTSKHLTEFHHLEAEYAWWDNDESMRFQERMVVALAHDIAAHCADDLRALGQDPERLARIGAFVAGESGADEDGLRFPRMTYHDAAARLRALGFAFPDGEDFGAPHELALTEGKADPIFVTDWPASIKAFYMHRLDRRGPGGEDLVACADLLAPDGFGEIIGGSQRSEDVEWMQERLHAQALHELDDAGAVAASRRWREILTGDADADDPEAFYSEVCEELRVELGRVRLAMSAAAPKTDAALAAAWRDAFWAEYRAPYEWYFDLRKYGSVPHSGFGLGIERLLRWFTGQEHIRDMLPYPRTPNRAYP
jgi:asparaginyl-tRNA synthetase